MRKNDRVKGKNDPSGEIWTIVEIKGDYAYCMVLDYNGTRKGTFRLEDLELAD